MTTFPGSPKVLKGALVSVDLPNPTPSVIVFQYNPGTLTRSLQAQTTGGEGRGPAGQLRFKGAPVETISLEVEIDATDQLEKEDTQTLTAGLHAQLAALETLLYPKSSQVIANLVQLQLGVVEIVPPVAPFTLFIWGPLRVLPVQLTEFRVTEDAHDVKLNPIRAKVSLSLRVLSYSDLLPEHPGHATFLAHHLAKEALAKIGSAGSLSDVGAEINL